MISAATVPDRSPRLISGESTGTSLTFTADEAGRTLSVRVNAANRRLIVTAAQHRGAQNAVENKVLDELCSIIVGRPLQEAADHGAIYTMAALPEYCLPVSGIRTPANAGAPFVAAERLIRAVHALARAHFQSGPRDNAWYTRASAAWLGMDELGRAAAIKPHLASFLDQNGLAEDAIWLSRIERSTRVTIAFSPEISYDLKPRLMLQLERHLRRAMNEPLELFLEEMKDENSIRRL